MIDTMRRFGPNERLWWDLTVDERLDEIRWRKTATPEQLEQAAALTAFWYESKDASERLDREIAALFDRKFGVRV